MQIVDPETGEPLPDGELGSICITELYKTGSPQFRYNIMDLSYLYPREQCACGSWLRRMAPFAGPRRQHGEAPGHQRVARSRRRGRDGGRRASRPTTSCGRCATDNRDEMIVSVVSDRDPSEHATLQAAVERRIKDQLGVRMQVEVVAPGALDEWTGVGTSPKLKRFRRR